MKQTGVDVGIMVKTIAGSVHHCAVRSWPVCAIKTLNEYDTQREAAGQLFLLNCQVAA